MPGIGLGLGLGRTNHRTVTVGGSSSWLLSGGIWNDSGVWDDSAVWEDS